MFIPLLVAKVFHIMKKSKKVKKCKEGMPQKKNQRVKRMKW